MLKFEKYAEEISVHGVKYVFAVGHAKATRVFFCCSLLLTLCGMSFYIFSAYQKFMVEPDIVTRSRDLDSDNFPAPAITICSSLYARDNFANFYKTFHDYQVKKTKITLSELECKYLASNLHWCQPNFSKMVLNICGMYDMKDLNVVEYINKSALQTDELFYNCPGGDCHDMFLRVFTDYGICYTYNMQGFNAIFNTEVIHDDFKCYTRQNYDNASDIQWSPEKGYASPGTEFPERAVRGNLVYFLPQLSPANTENICGSNSYRIFLHKPNEILTNYHEAIKLKYNEHMIFTIYIKSYRVDDALRSFSPQLRNCYFEGEKPLKYFKTYSKALCQLECDANHTLKECGCVKFSMPRGKDTPICTIHELSCTVNLPLIPCECLSPCSDLRYSFRYDKEILDRRYFEEKIPVNYSLSWVQFSMNSDHVEDTENLVTYKIQNFISDLGGLLGLFLGCSLISIVELIYYTISGLLVSLFNSNLYSSSRVNEENPNGVIPSVLQVSNHDILQVLNELMSTVNKISMKVDRNNEKITKIEEHNHLMDEKNSIRDKRIKVLEDTNDYL